MPLVSVPAVEGASSDTAGCCALAVRTSVSDPQREEDDSLIPWFPAAVEEAYTSVVSWGIQGPASPYTAGQNASQASHITEFPLSCGVKPLRTKSSAQCTAKLTSLDALATELVWSATTSHSTIIATILFLPGLSHADAPAARLVSLLPDRPADSTIDTMLMVISISHNCHIYGNATSLQCVAPCPHSLPDVWRMGSALDYISHSALELPALLPASARLPSHLYSGDVAFQLYLIQPLAAFYSTGESQSVQLLMGFPYLPNVCASKNCAQKCATETFSWISHSMFPSLQCTD